MWLDCWRNHCWTRRPTGLCMGLLERAEVALGRGNTDPRNRYVIKKTLMFVPNRLAC
jgi:hypothetical protein